MGEFRRSHGTPRSGEGISSVRVALFPAVALLTLLLSASTLHAQETVDPRSGRLFLTVTDIVVNAGPVILEVQRSLDTRRNEQGLLGTRWRLNWESQLFHEGPVLVIEDSTGPAIFTREGGSLEYRSPLGERVTLGPDGAAVRTKADLTSERFDARGRLVERGYRNGNRVTLGYGPDGRLARLDGPRGGFLQLIADKDGRLTRVESSTGAAVSYRYTGGELTEVEDARRRTTRYTFAGAALTRIVQSPNPPVEFAYDANGRVTARRWGGGLQERFEYDDPGHRVRHTDAAGEVITLQWSADRRLEEMTDAVGHKSVVESSAEGRPLRVTGPDGQVVTFTYDAQGRTSSVQTAAGQIRFEYVGDSTFMSAMTGPDGFRQTFEYDGQMNLTAVREGPRPTLQMTYTSDGLVESVREHGKPEQRFTYDAAGRLAATGDRLGNENRFEHDKRGNLVREVSPLGGVTRLTYDAQDRLVAIIDATGGTTRYEYDASGRLARVVEPAGGVIRYDYDAAGRRTSVTDAAGRVTRYEYDPAGRRVKTVLPGGATETYRYDAAGRLSGFTDILGRSARLAHDATGRVVSESTPEGVQITYRYDPAGRLVEWRDSLGAGEALRYDSRGRRVATATSTGATIRYDYDAVGDLRTVIEPLGGVRKLRYGHLGELAEVVGPDGSTVKYVHDAAGRITAIQLPGGGENRFGYDAMDNVLTLTDPLGRQVRRAYDQAGRLVSVTDGKGQTTTFAHDAAGRVIEKRLADGSVVKYEHDVAGNVVLADDGRFPVRFTYDAVGRLTRVDHVAFKRAIVYEYNANGQRSRVVGVDGRATRYEYDGGGRVRLITLPDGRAITVDHDARNSPTRMAYPNGITGSWHYDVEGRPPDLTYKDANGAVVAAWKSRYDAAGNRVETSDERGRQTRYAYDAAGQLVEESASPGASVRYVYGPGGNRTERITDAGRVGYRYDKGDQLVESDQERFAYDANGNLTERRGPGGHTRYQYDAGDRLVKVIRPDGTEVSFGYGPTGDRVWRRDPTGVTYFVHDRMNLVAELDESLNVKATYVHGPGLDRPLMMTVAGQRYFYLADALGSVRRLTDDAGRVVASYDYEAFGVTTISPGAVPSPFGFTAREYDAGVDLYFYRARFYDPGLGRFLTRDAIAGHRLDPLSLNPYVYVLNNPLRYVDPLGASVVGPYGPIDTLDSSRPPVKLGAPPPEPGLLGQFRPDTGTEIFAGPHVNDVDFLSSIKEHELHHWKQWEMFKAKWKMVYGEDLGALSLKEQYTRFKAWINKPTPDGLKVSNLLERGAAWQEAHHLVRDLGLDPKDPRVQEAIKYYQSAGKGDPSRLVESLERLAGRGQPPGQPPGLDLDKVGKILVPAMITGSFLSCMELGGSVASCSAKVGIETAIGGAIARVAAAAGMTGPQIIFVGGAIGWAQVGVEGYRAWRDAKQRAEQEAANKAQQEANRKLVDDLRKTLEAEVGRLEVLKKAVQAEIDKVREQARLAKPAADSAQQVLDSLRDLKFALETVAAACKSAQALRTQIENLVSDAKVKAKSVVEKVNAIDGQASNCQTQDDVDQLKWLWEGAKTLAGEAIAATARAQGVANRLNEILTPTVLEQSKSGAGAVSHAEALAAKARQDADAAAAAAKAVTAGIGAANGKAAELTQAKNAALTRIEKLRGVFPADLQGTFEALHGSVTAAASLPQEDLSGHVKLAEDEAARAARYADLAKDMLDAIKSYPLCEGLTPPDDLMAQATDAYTDALVYAGSDIPGKIQVCLAKLTPPPPTLQTLAVACTPSEAEIGQLVSCTASGVYSDNPSTVDLSSAPTVWETGPQFVAVAPQPSYLVKASREGLTGATTVKLKEYNPLTDPLATGGFGAGPIKIPDPTGLGGTVPGPGPGGVGVLPSGAPCGVVPYPPCPPGVQAGGQPTGLGGGTATGQGPYNAPLAGSTTDPTSTSTPAGGWCQQVDPTTQAAVMVPCASGTGQAGQKPVDYQQLIPGGGKTGSAPGGGSSGGSGAGPAPGAGTSQPPAKPAAPSAPATTPSPTPSLMPGVNCGPGGPKCKCGSTDGHISCDTGKCHCGGG